MRVIPGTERSEGAGNPVIMEAAFKHRDYWIPGSPPISCHEIDGAPE